jgi:hypothetical protein
MCRNRPSGFIRPEFTARNVICVFAFPPPNAPENIPFQLCVLCALFLLCVLFGCGEEENTETQESTEATEKTDQWYRDPHFNIECSRLRCRLSSWILGGSLGADHNLRIGGFFDGRLLQDASSLLEIIQFFRLRVAVGVFSFVIAL